MAGNKNQSDSEDANSEIRKAHFLVQYGDGGNDDTGSDISLFPPNDIGIYAEGLFLNLDWPGGGDHDAA